MIRLSLLYIARPIDRLSEPSQFLVNCLHAVTKHHKNAKFGLYRPELAFNVEGLPPESYVRMVNNTALLMSDGLLAIWPHDARSWGVPAEVERALTLSKPVVIVTDGKPTWSMVDEKIEIVQPTGKVDPDEMVRTAFQFLRLQVDSKEVF